MSSSFLILVSAKALLFNGDKIEADTSQNFFTHSILETFNFYKDLEKIKDIRTRRLIAKSVRHCNEAYLLDSIKKQYFDWLDNKNLTTTTNGLDQARIYTDDLKSKMNVLGNFLTREQDNHDPNTVLTQEELAMLYGLSDRSIASLERNSYSPSLRTVVRYIEKNDLTIKGLYIAPNQLKTASNFFYMGLDELLSQQQEKFPNKIHRTYKLSELSQLRVDCGLTQLQLAEKIGCNKSYIGKIESVCKNIAKQSSFASEEVPTINLKVIEQYIKPLKHILIFDTEMPVSVNVLIDEPYEIIEKQHGSSYFPELEKDKDKLREFALQRASKLLALGNIDIMPNIYSEEYSSFTDRFHYKRND